MIPSRLTVHCSATPDNRDVTVDEIRHWHTDPPPRGRGWKDIGYHFVIYRDGTVHPGRPIEEQGAHVEGANWENVGICMVGIERYSKAQWRSLISKITELQTVYKIPIEECFAHREFPSAIAQGKICPGFSGDLLRQFIYSVDFSVIADHVIPDEPGIPILE